MKRKLIHAAGAVTLRGTGRPAIVFGARGPPELLEHQVWLTELELLLGVEFDREAKAGKAIPDGMFTRDGVTYAVEVDNCGKQSRKQYREKWIGYDGYDGDILVATHTEERMRSVSAWIDVPRRSKCLFNTFERLVAGRPWQDWRGETTEL